MSQNSPPLSPYLIDARRRIADLFHDQCRHGAQTAALSDTDAAACGQFIGEKALRLQQRGLHGTAAALRVLSRESASPEQSRLLERLVRYVFDRQKIEVKATGRIDSKEPEIDSQNVIKQSELLHALSRVPTAISQVGELRDDLVQRLQGGIIQQKGWSYFLDRPTDSPDLLPTAYAILALSSAHEDVSRPTSYLLNQLKQASGTRKPVEVNADISIRVACLYSLAFREGGDAPESTDEATLCALFDPMWNSLERLLRDENIEQNVEYWRDDRTFYVRVPWQLYLLALAARLRYYRRSRHSRRRLDCDRSFRKSSRAAFATLTPAKWSRPERTRSHSTYLA
ncbi:MAG: hypothetical protein WD066_01165 [Planctomycetaceae bacterium]